MMIMKNVRIDADCPGTVMVGDVVFHIIKVSDERGFTIGVNAPPDMRISTSWNWKAKPVEPKPQDVV